MPLFRKKLPPTNEEDATFLYEDNPDPERYEEVAKTTVTVEPESADAEAVAVSEPEDQE